MSSPTINSSNLTVFIRSSGSNFINASVAENSLFHVLNFLTHPELADTKVSSNERNVRCCFLLASERGKRRNAGDLHWLSRFLFEIAAMNVLQKFSVSKHLFSQNYFLLIATHLLIFSSGSSTSNRGECAPFFCGFLQVRLHPNSHVYGVCGSNGQPHSVVLAAGGRMHFQSTVSRTRFPGDGFCPPHLILYKYIVLMTCLEISWQISSDPLENPSLGGKAGHPPLSFWKSVKTWLRGHAWEGGKSTELWGWLAMVGFKFL